ncbi:hypothetical protein M409DRAFT_20194 [Zasmidium cellare ATCC 36951]|uniref:Uncharacterized protein n=1 Tax=Zasmidium cellare ATCC 36951 TaxID=1080233 RepID=A0A6A6CUD0_ZASCE|nr:uncharacterized protein M409DRAFT_20194 [Zasmidium cellare ATCC 36951]KAF2169780.1 hypothetical protein M409DRAFT_20194 [Zasmidium cellare ATCC 36951]
MEPAPNHVPGPDVPRIEQNIPLTPFLERPAPYTSEHQLWPLLDTSLDPLALRRWPSEPEIFSSVPTQQPARPSLHYRRLRRLECRVIATVPGPTLASIGIDRQDTPRNLSSLDSILDSPERPTARPLLLPTPHSSVFPPTPWGFAAEENAEPSAGWNNNSTHASTPDRVSSANTGSSTPVTSRLRSPFDRRNALADIRSPLPTNVDHEGESGQSDLGHPSEHTNEDDALQAPPQCELKKKCRTSRFVEHLDISAPPQYFDRGELHDSGYDGDDEESA